MPDNHSQSASESAALRLAWFDWSMVPSRIIYEELGINYSTASRLRNTDEYKIHFQEIKDAWREQALSLPSTPWIRKKISANMVLAVNRLGEILGGLKTSAKDLIAAARLTAQMDGRFMGSDEASGDAPHSGESESVATELLQAIERQRKSVQ